MTEAAQRHWDAHRRLRQKDAYLDTVRHNQHDLRVPESLLADGRAIYVYAGIAAEKAERGKALVGDEPQWHVAQAGNTRKAQREREQVQNWLEGAYQSAVTQNPDVVIDDLVDDDLLLKGRGYLFIAPNPQAWTAMLGPRFDAAIGGQARHGSDDEASTPGRLNLDDARTMDQVVTLAEAHMAAADTLGAAAQAAHEQQESVARAMFPITTRWVPARNVVAYSAPNGRGLREVWEWQQWGLADFLATYVDADGNPLARDLATRLALAGATPTADDVVSVVIRADALHLQIAVTDVRLSSTVTDRRYAIPHGGPEWVWSAEHYMGEPPYAYFPGRQTTAEEPALRFHGFLDDAIHNCVLYDELMSQLYSITHSIAYPYPILEQGFPPQGVSPGTRPPRIELVEGEVYLGLPPGAKIVPLTQASPEVIQYLRESAAAVQARIDLQTLSAASAGTQTGESGYMYAQMSAASETTLEAARRGKERGWAHAGRLYIKAAKCLMDWGCGPIPVRHVSDEGAADVVLTLELAEQDWDIRCTVRGKPVGGELALTTTLLQQYRDRVIPMQTVRERLGYRNPTKLDEQILSEQIIMSGDLLKVIVQAVSNQVLAELQHQAAPQLPEQLMVPPALARILAEAGGEGAARLPQAWQQTAGLLPSGLMPDTGMIGPAGNPGGTGMSAMGGVPGAPNLTAQLSAGLGPPTMRPEVEGRGLMQAGMPSGQLGQAKGSPGSAQNMSQILGARGI